MEGKIHDYTLRLGITFACDQYCEFCNPKGIRNPKHMLEKEEIQEILNAAYENGIQKAHFTGGEPLMCNRLEEIIEEAIKDHEDFEFVFTTNGTRLHHYFESFKGKVAQINFSLHSMTPERQAELAHIPLEKVHQQIENLKKAPAHFPLVKLNCTALRTVNRDEVQQFFDFCQAYRIVLRMMELQPYAISGQKENFFKENFVSRKELMTEFGKLGELRPTTCKGDNFCVDYFYIGKNEVPVGVMYFTDLEFRCPGDTCKSIFVDARGNTHACSSQGFPYRENLAGKSFQEKVEILAKVIETKNKLRKRAIPYPEYHIPTYSIGRGGLIAIEPYKGKG